MQDWVFRLGILTEYRIFKLNKQSIKHHCQKWWYRTDIVKVTKVQNILSCKAINEYKALVTYGEAALDELDDIYFIYVVVQRIHFDLIISLT